MTNVDMIFDTHFYQFNREEYFYEKKVNETPIS